MQPDSNTSAPLCVCGCGALVSWGVGRNKWNSFLPNHHQFRDIGVRFWEKVDKNGPTPEHCPEVGPCWPWTGETNGQGYGSIRSFHPEKHRTAAHRLSWQLNNGPIPDGMCVLHKCDNPACVRPDHLFLGTQMENIHDMIDKGRDVRVAGDQSPSAKLTSSIVREMRALFSEGTYTQKDLARKFQISKSQVHYVVRGKQWSHVA